MRLADATQSYRATVARLHPTHAQWRTLDAETRAARWIWNRCVALGRRRRGRGSRLSYGALCHRLTRWRQRRPWLAEGSVVVQQQVAKAAAQALEVWAAGTARRPRFKSARRRDPVGLRYTARGLGAVTPATIGLAKLGPVRHGATRALAPVSSVDLVRDPRGWLISFRERVDAVPMQSTDGPSVGLDFGIAQSWTLSTGEAIHLPVPDDVALQRLRQLDRQMAKRRRPRGQTPSLRYDGARVARAALQRSLVHQRRDLLRHLAKRLAGAYAVIGVEDLNMASMSARRPGRGRSAKAGLNRALLQQSRGMALQAIRAATQRTGTHLVAVPAAYTSQTCLTCAHIAPENRESQAVFRCVACGFSAHADTVGAENVRRRARLRVAAQHHSTTGDDPPGGERTRRQAAATTRRPARDVAA
jgi:putative transposase